MKVWRSIDEVPSSARGRGVAIGIFDGVHRGHASMLEDLARRTRAIGAETLVYTFDPHPARLLSPAHAPLLIEPLEERLRRLEALGMDAVFVEPFTAELATMAPAAFVEDRLVGALGARLVVVGENFTFGAGARGDARLLGELGAKSGFEVHVAPLFRHRHQVVSSTVIRALVGAGDVRLAAELLGHRFALFGRVVRGDGRGRRLEIPTANLAPRNELIPATGVYATWAEGVFGRAKSVTNVGYAPTFGVTDLRVETHLLDVDPPSLRGTDMTLEFEERLRDEQTFSSAPALVEQIHEDVREARRRLDD